MQGARHGARPPGEAWLAATSHHEARHRPRVHPHIIHGHLSHPPCFLRHSHMFSLSAGSQDAVWDAVTLYPLPVSESL